MSEQVKIIVIRDLIRSILTIVAVFENILLDDPIAIFHNGQMMTEGFDKTDLKREEINHQVQQQFNCFFKTLW
jgi:hypothetical protein